MNSLKEILNDLDKPLTKEQLEKIIYNIFCIVIFITPIFSDIDGYGIYSLKATILNFTTIIAATSLLIINFKDIRSVKLTCYEILLISYLFFVILSTIFTEYGVIECLTGKNGRGEGLIIIFSYFITLIIFSKGYKYMTKVSKIALVAAIVVCIYSIVQANLPNGVKVPFIPKSKSGIARGTMRNQNFLSSYICLFLPMMCFYIVNSTKKIKGGIILSLMLFLSLVYSKTLGGYITFIIMYVIITVFSLIFSINKKQTIIRICLLTTIFIISFYIINYDGEQKYVTELSETKQEVIKLVNNDNKFGNSRMEVWKKCIKVIENNPILGTGPDSLERELRKSEYITSDEQDILKKYKVDKAHSEPLHIATTIGLPAAIIYIVFVGVIGIRLLTITLKNTKQKGISNEQTQYITMVLICFSSYLMQSVINISVIQVAPMYWAVLGTAMGIVKDNKMS